MPAGAGWLPDGTFWVIERKQTWDEAQKGLHYKEELRRLNEGPLATVGARRLRQEQLQKEYTTFTYKILSECLGLPLHEARSRFDPKVADKMYAEIWRIFSEGVWQFAEARGYRLGNDVNYWDSKDYSEVIIRIEEARRKAILDRNIRVLQFLDELDNAKTMDDLHALEQKIMEVMK